MNPAALARAGAAPASCAVVLLVLLVSWVSSGGGGTVRQVRISVSLAAVPAPASGGDAASTAPAYLTIRNLSGTADILLSASSPAAARVITTGTSTQHPAGPASEVAIPAHATISLNPFGPDLVLIRPRALIAGQVVLLRLRFQHAGMVTVRALVTPPGTP